MMPRIQIANSLRLSAFKLPCVLPNRTTGSANIAVI